MGYYINPKDGKSKEEFLSKNSIKTTLNPPCINKVDNNVWVCLIDNGPFTAAGICYSKEELGAFARDDGRAKLWCLVPIYMIEEFMGKDKIT